MIYKYKIPKWYQKQFNAYRLTRMFCCLFQSAWLTGKMISFFAILSKKETITSFSRQFAFAQNKDNCRNKQSVDDACINRDKKLFFPQSGDFLRGNTYIFYFIVLYSVNSSITNAFWFNKANS